MSNFILSLFLIGASGFGFGSGRFWANLAAACALISVAMGASVLYRSTVRVRSKSASMGAIFAMISALAGIVFSGLHLAYSVGGVGTGNGRLGAIVAQALGLIGLILSGIALARAHRLTVNSTTDK